MKEEKKLFLEVLKRLDKKSKQQLTLNCEKIAGI